MLDQHPHTSGIFHARRRAAKERLRAVRAARVALRHERLAEQGSPNLRDLHLDMAKLHHDMAKRHRAAERLHTDHAERLAMLPAGGGRPFMAAVAAQVGARHVGISIVAGDRIEAVTVASDPVVTAVQQHEFTLGEGPVHDVAAAGDPVVADESAFPVRWPRLAPAVARLGVRSVAAEPLLAEDGCVGVLTVFDPPAAPSATSLAVVADTLVHSVLLVPDSADPLDDPLLADAEFHAIVHQASGVVAHQLGCTADDGLVVLRARAFATDTPLLTLADDVVHRGLKVT